MIYDSCISLSCLYVYIHDSFNNNFDFTNYVFAKVAQAPILESVISKLIFLIYNLMLYVFYKDSKQPWCY